MDPRQSNPSTGRNSGDSQIFLEENHDLGATWTEELDERRASLPSQAWSLVVNHPSVPSSEAGDANPNLVTSPRIALVIPDRGTPTIDDILSDPEQWTPGLGPRSNRNLALAMRNVTGIPSGSRPCCAACLCYYRPTDIPQLLQRTQEVQEWPAVAAQGGPAVVTEEPTGGARPSGTGVDEGEQGGERDEGEEGHDGEEEDEETEEHDSGHRLRPLERKRRQG